MRYVGPRLAAPAVTMRFSHYFYRWSQFPQLHQHQPCIRQFSSYSGRFRFIDGGAEKGLVGGRRANFLSLQLNNSRFSYYNFPPRCNPRVQSSPCKHLAGLVPGILTFRSIHLHSASPMSSVNLRTKYPSTRYCDGNGTHLGPGTECPPLVDGKVRIYNMRFCPYAQRAVLVAEAKGVPYDVVNVNLKTKPEWIFAKNPMGKVPTLELPSGDVLYESLIVADYLDDVYPGRKLNSSDPLRRAQDRILIENFGTVISSFYKLVFSRGDTDQQSTHLQGIRNGLAPFERELTQRGTKFFGGADAPGMVDYMIWPWVERMSLFKVAFPDLSDYQNDKKENPKLEQWRQAMKEDPAVKIYYLTPEQHFHFAASYLQGEMPDYDCLEELNSKI